MPESVARGTEVTFAADPTRLPQDVDRGRVAMEWGVMAYQVDPKQPRYKPKTWRGEVRMIALLPDDRRAYVIASGVHDAAATAPSNQTSVRIQVGDFGDAATERSFVEALRKVMAGEPQPVRGWGFEIP